MVKQKKIIIEIDANGNISIDGNGFVGPECGYFIYEIQESIGKQTSQHNKREYYQKQTSKNKNMQRGSR